MSQTNATELQDSQRKKKSKFTQEEDNMLCELVARFGEDNWKLVSMCMRSRSVRQCRERWRNYLSPRVVNAPWTVAEDFLLESKFREFGPKWKTIAAFFPMRTDIQVKNRILLKQRQFERIARNFPLQFPHPVPVPVTVSQPPQDIKSSDVDFEIDFDADFDLDDWIDLSSQLCE